MDKFGEGLLAVVSGAFTLAIIAVIFSSKGQAPQVIGSAGKSLSTVISAATNPYSGGNTFALRNSYGDW